MSAPFNPPAPILEVPSELKEQAKARIQSNLAQLVKKLSGTIFYNDSPCLSNLKVSLGGSVPGKPVDIADSVTDEDICEMFVKYVPFTIHDDYQPYISKLLTNEPCQLNDIEHLLAPGLPDFVAHTSGTSGSSSKYFPKYPSPLYSNRPRWDSAEAAKTVKLGLFGSLCFKRLIRLTGHDGENLPSIPLTIVSSGHSRAYLKIGTDDDANVVTKKASFMTSPWAVWYLPSYTCSIHAYAFFALADKSAAVLVATVPTVITDSITAICAQWTTWIEAIARGILPEFPDLPLERREQLQAHLQPDVGRAAELRAVNVEKEGWLKEVWPSVALITVPLSGPYAMTIPKIRYNFGPSVVLRSYTYAATESVVGWGYDTLNTNLYRLASDEHIELLDVEKECSIDNISQPWEVQVGKKYEVICTNADGLWRYTLEDIVEVVGFGPIDGQPLIKYIERKGIGFRVAGEFVSQGTLQEAMRAAQTDLGNAVEFTVVMDERNGTRAYGFLVELDGDLGPNAHFAAGKIQAHLYSHAGYQKYTEDKFIANATLRVLAPGTFAAFRERKINATGSAIGQIKIPCTITDLDTKEWLLKRVVHEL
ncbi:hypothetical protein D9619_006899 [Psilocybe cf. subviscida]|uniref:Uncharacterized protein n=1 Tax=Psilocybe cf. subviscida TaxID=2480587 RepID=A0A8H5B4E7_9AGAR|nr:hypothetical protein D9619_006899 [Psilocybe cf. subviscida]